MVRSALLVSGVALCLAACGRGDPAAASAPSIPASPGSPAAQSAQSAQSSGDTMTQPSSEIAAYSAFLLAYRDRYPRSLGRDYYKLIHQSVFGVGHLIASRQGARDYLDRETSGLEIGPVDGSPVEPLLEPLDPAGSMVRVNLRPFVASVRSSGRTEDLDGLIDAMMETARTVRGDPSLFDSRFGALQALVSTGAIALDEAEIAALERRARDQHYPVVHHSDAYRQAYSPAYRVVLRKAFDERWR